jgi:hypothetical protein
MKFLRKVGFDEDRYKDQTKDLDAKLGIGEDPKVTDVYKRSSTIDGKENQLYLLNAKNLEDDLAAAWKVYYCDVVKI